MILVLVVLGWVGCWDGWVVGMGGLLGWVGCWDGWVVGMGGLLGWVGCWECSKYEVD